jgi:hypothetical protein
MCPFVHLPTNDDILHLNAERKEKFIRQKEVKLAVAQGQKRIVFSRYIFLRAHILDLSSSGKNDWTTVQKYRNTLGLREMFGCSDISL